MRSHPVFQQHIFRILDAVKFLSLKDIFEGLYCRFIYSRLIQGVPLATEPGIEGTATKFEHEYVRCVRNEEECVCSVCL